MSVVHLDTHVVVWMFVPLRERLRPALPHLNGRTLAISPMVQLELQCLHEIGRLTVPATTVIESLRDSVGLQVANEPWDAVVRAALGLDWTRDPFDRLIAAHALLANAPLVTADETIRRHAPHAVWDGPPIA